METHVILDEGNGIFALTEAGYVLETDKIHRKAAIGVLHSTANFQDTGKTDTHFLGAYSQWPPCKSSGTPIILPLNRHSTAD